MTRISNNITIFLKLFIPTFWFVFFTSFLIASFTVNPDTIPFLASWQVRLGIVVMYLVFGLFLYFTVMQLQRVDMGPEKVYVSNYFRTYAYNYQDVSKIEEHHYGLFRIMVLNLNAAGSLGKLIRFIPSYKNYEFFRAQNPDLFNHLDQSNS